MRRIIGFGFTVKPEEMRKVLGYGNAKIPPKVRDALEWAETTGRGLVEPLCAYRFLQREDFAASDYLRGLDRIAICLVTIGGRLEHEVDRLKEEGRLSEALFLDTYGSAAAEACADTAEQLIATEVSSMGLCCSRRFSPGYGGWDVAEQRWILAALGSETLGVKLTEGCMMVPRKSITFAMVTGEEPLETGESPGCRSCDLADCRFKRIIEERERGEEE